MQEGDTSPAIPLAVGGKGDTSSAIPLAVGAIPLAVGGKGDTSPSRKGVLIFCRFVILV